MSKFENSQFMSRLKILALQTVLIHINIKNDVEMFFTQIISINHTIKLAS